MGSKFSLIHEICSFIRKKTCRNLWSKKTKRGTLKINGVLSDNGVKLVKLALCALKRHTAEWRCNSNYFERQNINKIAGL